MFLSQNKTLILKYLGIKQDQMLPADIAQRWKTGETSENDLLYITRHILQKEYGEYKYQSNVAGNTVLNYEEWLRSIDLNELVSKYI